MACMHSAVISAAENDKPSKDCLVKVESICKLDREPCKMSMSNHSQADSQSCIRDIRLELIACLKHAALG